MPSCTSCGQSSPTGYSFCLNCGSKIGAAVELSHAGETPREAKPLPPICPQCGTQNQIGTHFCQHCGRAIAASTAPEGGGQPPQAVNTAVGHGDQHPPPDALKVRNRPHPVTPGPDPSFRDGPRPMSLPSVSPASLVPSSSGPSRTCPFCHGQTPVGLRFCQRCGKSVDSAPGVASAATAAKRVGSFQGVGPVIGTDPTAPPIDSGAAMRSARWGTLVCLNRDGSQGAEYPLAGEFVDIGSDCQIRFDDPFLAPRHLRLTRESGALWAVPLDRINGSFIRVFENTVLASPSTLLLGRELLRFEQLSDAERQVVGAVQHGVSIFGSPVRDAWGRLHQLMPNGCSRDIRHLIGAEVIIGREEGDVVFADDEFLSRRHCSLHWRDGSCELQDLGSSNGCFVQMTRRSQLESGVQLRFGDQMVRIDLAGA